MSPTTTTSFLIRQAYSIRDFQIAGAPDWIRTLCWEINAKQEAGSAVDQESIKKMMQSLLVDRFRLKFLRETRKMPVYRLKVALPRADPNGPRTMSMRGAVTLKFSPRRPSSRRWDWPEHPEPRRLRQILARRRFLRHCRSWG